MFTCKLHKNLLATHKNTFEFTKDKHLTLKGDCIIGVDCDFGTDFPQGKVRIVLKNGRITDESVAYTNKSFNNPHEMVIRKSDFRDGRTFAVKSNKAAIDLNRELFRKGTIKVEIEKVKIKAIIFDFDGTLEVWAPASNHAVNVLAHHINDKYGININTFTKEFFKAEAYYTCYDPSVPDQLRSRWIADILKKFKIRKCNPQQLEKIYWDAIVEKIALFKHSKEILSRLGKKYKLALLSNSDGALAIKDRRINKLGIKHYFDAVITTDATHVMKPDIRNYVYTCKKLKVKPYECLMVGNHPRTDLLGAKKLGMTTVLIAREPQEIPGYVDFTINSIKELPGIIKRLA